MQTRRIIETTTIISASKTDIIKLLNKEGCDIPALAKISMIENSGVEMINIEFTTTTTE